MFAPETQQLFLALLGLLQASMRPGHVCPGNRGMAPEDAPEGLGFNEAGACLPRKRRGRKSGDGRRGRASMRPGHVCPGNAALGEDDDVPRARFNEAGACLPRKLGRPRSQGARDHRFNEAGACLPRKLDIDESIPHIFDVLQ